jgi:kynureninase
MRTSPLAPFRSTSPRSTSTSRSAAASSGSAAGLAPVGSTSARISPNGWSRPSPAGRHARPFAFEPEQEYAEDAARFLTGTPNVPALYAATAGYELIDEIGVERIREHSLRQTALLVELLEGAGFEVLSPRSPDRRGGTVVVRTPEAEAVYRELGTREIICDFRPDAGIRLGPHFFNTDDELRFAAGQIAEIVESGAYERHLDAAAR